MRFLLFVLVLLSQVARSEIIPIYLILDASSTEVHFVRGWLEAPAHIDISQLTFQATDEPDFYHGDDDEEFDFDDDFEGEGDDYNVEGDDYEGEGDDYYNELADDLVELGDDLVPEDDNDTLETPAPEESEGTPAPDESEGTPAPDESEGTDSPTSAPTGDETTPPKDNDETEDEGTPEPDEGESTTAPSPGDRRRYLDGEAGGDGKQDEEADGGGKQRVDQLLDIVVFFLPDDCKKDASGACDWHELGVGARDTYVDGDVSYCCGEDTAARAICTTDDVGRLIIDQSKFTGEHRTAKVPTTADANFKLDNSMFEITQTGEYVMLLGNCDDYGMEVLALGNMEWKSVGGYLPGDLFGLMFFYAGLTAFYLLLAVWYWCGMKMFQDAAIPIQKYIIATIILGLFELFTRALDLGIWNMQGLRSYGIVYTSLVLGVLKRGISRCLGVMVAMGWGVVREGLGFTLFKIVVLGMIYSGLTLFRDFFVIFASVEVETLSLTAEEELMDFALILTPLILIINLTFYWWIISSLNATTEYLKNMNQTSKLRRHMRLRCLIFTSVLIAAAWLVFSIVDVMADILSPDMMWVMEGAMHLNYVFVLTGVAILWRPNSNAKEYAMQMEVPALGGDEENELELSCVVPSAGDLDDGDEFRESNGTYT